ncbi:MAG: pantetheine-phosphate adenylyltransferase [Oscillospiraceae bacterium]|nr:pantetheine-phosphate adenylyltransferase [Oscillospiraceae bacterium]
MGTAIYPGSFDPVTLGHLDIIKRAAIQFERVIVCVMVNSEKRGLFRPEERVELIRRVTADLDNVEVDQAGILLSDYARNRGATVVVKGLREMSDFEKEFQMALINRKLNPELDTMFLTSRQNFTYLSSSIVKEMALYHVPLTDFVPAEIADEVQERVDAARRT